MDYYISQFGKDSNTGISLQHPWRSIDRINNTRLNPGDSVWFQAGQTFKGNVTLFDLGVEYSAEPIIFRSYGEGKATIDAGTGSGFLCSNTNGVHVIDLKIIGDGIDNNNGSGICFFNTLPGHKKLSNILVDKVEVAGFKQTGICIGADPIDGTWSGFRNVKITHAIIHDNGDAGVNCYGVWNPEDKGYSHQDIYIGYCRVYRNDGLVEKETHTGNGIVLGQVNVGTIEYCLAYENGKLNSSEEGGPVGIWTWDSNRVLIQCNESHHNRTGSGKDGGGFDLDGGVRNSIVQNNYSHDNDGAGFLLAQFGGARAYNRNVIRYNLSENDGRKNAYGGIHVWSTGANGGIRDTTIYQNMVITSVAENGDPVAVDCISEGIHNIRFYNNTFITEGKVSHIRCKANSAVIFEDNSCLIN
ncbi:hypothetical protein JT359_09775 [Candidatus Poribacteria bacterium]|nr:hypothetical protein [Candidatus Poribacteria bacterium]